MEETSKPAENMLAAMSVGNLSPDEASTVASVISSHVRLIETADLEARLAALEEKASRI